MDILSWLGHAAGSAARAVASGAADLINTVVGGLVRLLSSLFGNVGGAWDDFTRAAAELAHAAETFGSRSWHQFWLILHYLIPKYAFTAWWWVTHPDDLANHLFWYMVRWLERRAFTVGRYLGGFLLAMLVHNVHRVLSWAEDVIDAVL